MGINARLFRQARHTRLPLWLTVVFSLLNGLLVILQAWLLSYVVSEVFLNGSDLPGVQDQLLALLVVIGLRAGAVFGSESAASQTAIDVKTSLRQRLAAHLFRLGPAYTADQRSGELSAALVEGVEALEAYFSQYLPQLLLAALLPLIVLIAVFPMDVMTGVVLLVTAPLMPLFMYLIGSLAQRLTDRQYQALGRLSGHFLDSLQGLTTLKLLGQSQAQARRVGEVSDRFAAATLSVLRVTFLSALVLEWLATISTAIVAVEIGLRLLYGGLNFQDAFFILILAPEFYMPLRALGSKFHAGMAGVSAARRIFEILAMPLPEYTTPAGATGLSSSGFSIAVEDVHYAYRGGERPALQGVSLRIEFGQRVALVGASGAGKSTLASLLLGFIRPDSGSIKVYPLNEKIGLDVSAIPISDWRARVAWVPQQPYLFNDTLAANLCLGKPDASPEAVAWAVEQAGLDDLVNALPDGVQTLIGEGGQRLSGGQAQRLALGRAFLKDAPFLILDEPTSAVDPSEELRLQTAIERIMAGRTTLVIAHRLNTVYSADQIVVLSGGRVVEQGTHTQLIARQGQYARLVRAYGGQ